MIVIFMPYFWVWAVARGLGELFKGCSCDEVVCWVRKEYSTRNFFRVYPNRIEFNEAKLRIPFGFLGCGSWNSDNITTNVSVLREIIFVAYLKLMIFLLSTLHFKFKPFDRGGKVYFS
jgi:hypothetical protein